jgi:hypothetical protein
LNVSLPIVKGLSQELEWNMVKYETHTYSKSSKNWDQAEMPVLKMRCKPGMKVKDVKALLL